MKNKNHNTIEFTNPIEESWKYAVPDLGQMRPCAS
jgi:hypothetical protein